jgi:hypothetical protein
MRIATFGYQERVGAVRCGRNRSAGELRPSIPRRAEVLAEGGPRNEKNDRSSANLSGMVNPLILGGGKTLLKDVKHRHALELVRTKQLQSGKVSLTYQVASM